jgi:hypothetical protein
LLQSGVTFLVQAWCLCPDLALTPRLIPMLRTFLFTEHPQREPSPRPSYLSKCERSLTLTAFRTQRWFAMFAKYLGTLNMSRRAVTSPPRTELSLADRLLGPLTSLLHDSPAHPTHASTKHRSRAGQNNMSLLPLQSKHIKHRDRTTQRLRGAVGSFLQQWYSKAACHERAVWS